MYEKKSICCLPDHFFTEGIPKFFYNKWKKNDKFRLNYHGYIIQPLVCVFLDALSKNTIGKNFSPGGGVTSTFTEGVFPPCVQKIIYDLTIAIINKCFEFQNDQLKNLYWVQWHALSSYTTALKKSKISNNIGTTWAICTKR